MGPPGADAWHAPPAEAVLKRLRGSPQGLTPQEAPARLARHGPNELVQTTRVSPLKILLEQFTDVLVIVLIAAAIISGALGLAKGEATELYDAGLIVVIVILNATLGFVQEYRAEKSLQALKALAAPRAHVLRGGEIASVPTREVVPGDIVVLGAGDRVPGDARLLEVASTRTNEASLTGESTPVSKIVGPLPGKVFLGDRRNMVFMGTTVDGGRGRAVVVATGMATELGKIAGIVFLIGFLQNPDQVEILFLTAVGLAVAAIPEGLPAVVTICLALGLQRMIKRHALVRKLPAVEALGAATVICSDKTGTLTKGEMNVRSILAGG